MKVSGENGSVKPNLALKARRGFVIAELLVPVTLILPSKTNEEPRRRSELFQVFDIAEFTGPPKFNQTLWPNHCIQGSEGAKLHKELMVRTELFKSIKRNACEHGLFTDSGWSLEAL